jgi:periplasmic nitrate reductase NapE
MRTEQPAPPEPISRRRMELAMFLLLAVFVWPLISVILVGGFGFIVWMKQLFFGPAPLI